METAPPNLQQILDNEHLKLLSIFHYVVGGIAAFFACIPILHLVIGLFFILAPEKFGHGSNQPPAFIGWFFVVFASIFILAGWTLAILILLAGRFIARRKTTPFALSWPVWNASLCPLEPCLGCSRFWYLIARV